MTPAPTVSVVIPTYKHRDTVLGTLDSVFAQTFADYEVVVVNDGSPDDTERLLRPLADAGRIRLLSQPNAGQAAARNNGIAEARGQYIALLDDDDLWPPDKLQTQVATLDAAPNAVMTYGYAQTFGGEQDFRHPGTREPSGGVWEDFLQRNPILSPGQTLVRASALRAVGGFDPAVWGADDWDLWIRLAAHGPVLYQEHFALRYRLHAGNASKDTWRMYVNSCRVQHKHLGRVPRPGRVRLWRSCRAFIWSNCFPPALAQARQATADGDRAQARKLWRRVLQMKPQSLRDAQVVRLLLRAHFAPHL